MATEQKTKRKLSAILSADVKGYSTLMTNDEFTTIKTLKAYRAIMSDNVKEHSGRVVDALGDNMLAEFLSAVEAVLCSIAIQNILKTENDTLPDDKRLEFRIGINVGDVVQDGDSLFGEGVNIAARIEGLAEPGGICISRNAYDHVRNKLELDCDYIGEHNVKNIKNPVRVYKVLMGQKDDSKRIKKEIKPPAKNTKIKTLIKISTVLILVLVAVLAGAYWKHFYMPAPVAVNPEGKVEFNLSERPAIAVLPFVNLNQDTEMEYFCYGMTDNLIATLAQTSLLVIDHNSTSAYKNKSTNVQQIGRELGADYVVKGSIQRAEEQFRLSVQLIESNSDQHLWARNYNREFKDILDLQDEIVLQILKNVGVKIQFPWAQTNELDEIKDINTYIKFAKVLEYNRNPTKEGYGYASAVKDAEEIIASAPKYQGRYDWLAMVHLTGIFLDACESDEVCYMKALELTKRSLSLNENNHVAHQHLAWLFILSKEYEKAIASMKKSLGLYPNKADGYYTLSFALNDAGRYSEALENMKIAMRLNPIPTVGYLLDIGKAYLGLGQFEKAIEMFHSCLKKQAFYWPAYLCLAITYDLSGQEEKAKESAKKLLNLNPDYTIEKYKIIAQNKDLDRLERSVKALIKAGVPGS